MTNAEIAQVFEQIGMILDLQAANPFRIRAYERAAQVISLLPRDLRDIYRHEGLDGLKELPGIGDDLALKIEEMLKTGQLGYMQSVRKGLPEGLFHILEIEGMGPKKTKFVWQQFHVKNIEDLEALAKSGKLTDLKGWGEKSVANILRGIEARASMGGRLPIWAAQEIADEIMEYLRSTKLCKELEIAGSLRRKRETIGDIDILATSTKPGKVIEAFCGMAHVKRTLARGDTKASVVVAAGPQVDLRVVEPNVFGAALHYFTGSKDHNVKIRSLALKRGVTLSEYGVYRGTAKKKGELLASKTEEDVFASVGLPYIPPEMREDRGEIEAGQKKALPILIELQDIMGDLHMHTDFSDGAASMIAMAKAAKEIGLEYIAITDHASSIGVVKGLKENGGTSMKKKGKGNIEEYLALVDAARKAVPGILILAGAEVDILPDGSLFLSDASLAKLDWVVASIHGSFHLSREQTTKRLLRAIENPHVRLIGHPTARELQRRPGVEFDVEEVFAAAKKHGVLLELNASSERLDLPDTLCMRAREEGCLISIDSDAHTTRGFDYRFGISQARRAWLTKKDVVNTKKRKEFEAWLKGQK